jgi:NAD(P)-dependent dehydrogenase (short-subunit alcohol dehydrogenase family)
MIPAKRGQIAIVASVAGCRGLLTSAHYGASKAALINLAASLKFDLDRAGAKLRLVNPGFVKTPLTDRDEFSAPFLMEADDIDVAMREQAGDGSICFLHWRFARRPRNRFLQSPWADRRRFRRHPE